MNVLVVKEEIRNIAKGAGKNYFEESQIIKSHELSV